MKAFVINAYGSPASLQLKEVETPIPKKNEVLVKIHATAINDYDWSYVRGKPYLYRLLFGLLKPKTPIPGMEFSGTVVLLGEDADSFEIGDAVYGDTSEFGFGTFAEYIAIDQKALTKKPEMMSFEEAAAIPHAGLLAYQGFVDIGKIQPRQQILINGGGGGVGVFGIQLAKQLDCEVTGVDASEKLDMMKTNGFDHVIDYKKEDFTKSGVQYDLILDCKTTRSPFSYVRSLKQKGTYVTVGGNLIRLIQIFLLGGIISFFTQKKLRILALKPNKCLERLNELFLNGKLRCEIDGPHPFKEIPELLQYFGEGKHKGKIVVILSTEN